MKKVNFTLISNVITISLEGAGNGQLANYVITERFRPLDLRTTPNGSDVQSYTLESEVINDIKYQVDFINRQGSFVPAHVIAALKDACRNHISKCGRLIFTDLLTYVDCTLHILSVAADLNTSEANNIYKGYVNKMIEEFKENIYVARPHGLVKLSSLL